MDRAAEHPDFVLLFICRNPFFRAVHMPTLACRWQSLAITSVNGEHWIHHVITKTNPLRVSQRILLHMRAASRTNNDLALGPRIRKSCKDLASQLRARNERALLAELETSSAVARSHRSTSLRRVVPRTLLVRKSNQRLPLTRVPRGGLKGYPPGTAYQARQQTTQVCHSTKSNDSYKSRTSSRHFGSCTDKKAGGTIDDPAEASKAGNRAAESDQVPKLPLTSSSRCARAC